MEGPLKWCSTSADGRAVTFGGLSAGSWFGEGTLLRGGPRKADIVALRHSRIAALPSKHLAILRNEAFHSGCEAVAVRVRQRQRQHDEAACRDVGTQLISNESPNPNFIDAILALLEAAGFKDNQLVHAYNVVIAAMVGFVTMELASRPADDPQGWAEAHESHMQSVSPQKHPTLARNLPKLLKSAFIVRSSNGMEHPLDESFEAWVMVCLQGLSAMLHPVPATSKNKNVRQRR